MKTQAPLARPENRCLSGAEAAPQWDSLRHGLRSEAFAEDLPAADSGVEGTIMAMVRPGWSTLAQGHVDGWVQAWFREAGGAADRLRSGTSSARA